MCYITKVSNQKNLKSKVTHPVHLMSTAQSIAVKKTRTGNVEPLRYYCQLLNRRSIPCHKLPTIYDKY